jgi:hypothetical protein
MPLASAGTHRFLPESPWRSQVGRYGPQATRVTSPPQFMPCVPADWTPNAYLVSTWKTTTSGRQKARKGSRLVPTPRVT